MSPSSRVMQVAAAIDSAATGVPADVWRAVDMLTHVAHGPGNFKEGAVMIAQAIRLLLKEPISSETCAAICPALAAELRRWA